jgi:hypothetical protein
MAEANTIARSSNNGVQASVWHWSLVERIAGRRQIELFLLGDMLADAPTERLFVRRLVFSRDGGLNSFWVRRAAPDFSQDQALCNFTSIVSRRPMSLEYSAIGWGRPTR